MQILQNYHSQDRRGEQAGWAALAPIPGVALRALGTRAGTVSQSSRELWWQWPHMASPNVPGDNHCFIWYQEIHTYLLVWLRRKCGISVWKGRRRRRRKGAVGKECWIIPKCENPSVAIKRKLNIHHNHPDSTWQYRFTQTTAEDEGLSTRRSTLYLLSNSTPSQPNFEKKSPPLLLHKILKCPLQAVIQWLPWTLLLLT